MCYAMKIDAFVKECVGLSFLVYYSPILVWEGVEVAFDGTLPFSGFVGLLEEYESLTP